MGCSQSNTLPPPPRNFSGADEATPPLKLKQTRTDKQTSGVNGWCHFESWPVGSDVIHDMELKAACTQNTLHLPGYPDREREMERIQEKDFLFNDQKCFKSV